MVLKPLQSAYTWRKKDKSLLFKYCPALCPFVVHQRVVQGFNAFIYLRDTGYYRRHSFLGRRKNRYVICSVAFNFGLMTFLAVAASLHKKQNLIYFFCSHIWTSIWIHCRRVLWCVAKDICVEKALSVFWNVVVTPPKEGVSILPFLRVICVFLEWCVDLSQTSSSGSMRNLKVSFLFNSFIQFIRISFSSVTDSSWVTSGVHSSQWVQLMVGVQHLSRFRFEVCKGIHLSL